MKIVEIADFGVDRFEDVAQLRLLLFGQRGEDGLVKFGQGFLGGLVKFHAFGRDLGEVFAAIAR